MKREDLGQYFIKDGEIYYALGYISNPAIELRNINTGQKEVVVIGSMVSREYSKLFSIPVEENGYNLDKAKPVNDLIWESDRNEQTRTK